MRDGISVTFADLVALIEKANTLLPLWDPAPYTFPFYAIPPCVAVASEAAMLRLRSADWGELGAGHGGIAIRTDLMQAFQLTAEPATVLGNWHLMPVQVAVGDWNLVGAGPIAFLTNGRAWVKRSRWSNATVDIWTDYVGIIHELHEIRRALWAEHDHGASLITNDPDGEKYVTNETDLMGLGGEFPVSPSATVGDLLAWRSMRLVCASDAMPTTTVRTRFDLYAQISSVTRPDVWVDEYFGVWVFKVRTGAVLVETTFTVYDFPNIWPLPGFRAHVLTGSTDLIQSFTGGPGTGQTIYNLSGALVPNDRKITFKVEYGTTRAVTIRFGVQIDNAQWGEVDGIHGTTKLWSCETGLNSQVPLPRFLTVKQDGTKQWASTVKRTYGFPEQYPLMRYAFSTVEAVSDAVWIGTPLARGYAFLAYEFFVGAYRGPMLGPLMAFGTYGGYTFPGENIVWNGSTIGQVTRRVNPVPMSYWIRHVDDSPNTVVVNSTPPLDNGAVILITLSRAPTVQAGTIFVQDSALPAVEVVCGCIRNGSFTAFAGSLVLPAGVRSKAFSVFWPVLQPVSLCYSGPRVQMHALFSTTPAQSSIENGNYKIEGSLETLGPGAHWPFAGWMVDELENALDVTDHTHPHDPP